MVQYSRLYNFFEAEKNFSTSFSVLHELTRDKRNCKISKNLQLKLSNLMRTKWKSNRGESNRKLGKISAERISNFYFFMNIFSIFMIRVKSLFCIESIESNALFG